MGKRKRRPRSERRAARDGSGPGTTALMGLFAVLTLAVGGGLVGVYLYAMQMHAAAKSWRATPCRIVEHRRQSIEYEYVVAGRTYRSDREDLLPGDSGDVARWRRELRARFPVDQPATCYVDPLDPTSAVLDRDRTPQAAAGLRILALPFLIAGAVFGFATVRGLLSFFRGEVESSGALEETSPAAEGRDRRRPIVLAPPPRSVGFATTVRMMLSPTSVQMSLWIVLAGCIFLLAAFGMFEVLEDWIAPRARVETQGRVTHVGPSGNRELGFSLQAVDFEFQVAGRRFSGRSYAYFPGLATGEAAAVRYDPTNPEHAAVVGLRSNEIPLVFGLGILFVAAAIALGWLAMIMSGYRNAWLLAHGASTPAVVDRNDQGLVCRYQVDGIEHVAAHPHLPPPQRRAASRTAAASYADQSLTMLYDPARPSRCVVLEGIADGPTLDARGEFVPTRWSDMLSALCVPMIGGAACWLIYQMVAAG